jgi:hypothetical protein
VRDNTVPEMIAQANRWAADAAARNCDPGVFYLTRGELDALTRELGRFQNTDLFAPPSFCGMRLKVVDAT